MNKKLTEVFSMDDILDAFFGALLFTFVLFVPVFIILGEMIVVYMYRLTFLIILIIIALFCFVFVLHLFWKKSLTLKNPEHKLNLKKKFLKSSLIVNSVILVLGLLFILFIVPILWV